MSCQPRGKLGWACPFAPRSRPREEPLAAKDLLNLQHSCPSMRVLRRAKVARLCASRESFTAFGRPNRPRGSSQPSGRTFGLVLPEAASRIDVRSRSAGKTYLSKMVCRGLVPAVASMGGDPTEERISRQPWTGSNFIRRARFGRAWKPHAFRCELVSPVSGDLERRNSGDSPRFCQDRPFPLYGSCCGSPVVKLLPSVPAGVPCPVPLRRTLHA